MWRGLLLGLFFVGSAAAETRSEWFKSLRQPLTGASCCDISDCKKTEARVSFELEGQSAKEHWEVKVEGTWTPVPSEVILEKRSVDGEAYVCIGSRILCFIKPDFIF